MKTIIRLCIAAILFVTMTGCGTNTQPPVDNELAEYQKIEQEILENLTPSASFEITNTDGDVLLTAEHLAKAEWQQSNNNLDNPAEPVVVLTFNAEGSAKFADVTTQYIGQELQITLDGDIISSPVINEPITDGKAVIANIGTMEDAITIAARIQSVIDKT